ncbi:mitochondrial carrier domain-containing protein [Terfezia claveryi]|nr:mitochondrial carrier domain-containing protein [Terfezia claveryi]
MPPDSWTNFDFDEDPTDFEGLSPVPYGEKAEHQHPSRAASLAHGTSAAGARAFTTQLIAFYFRAPVKAFFKMRVDYMQVARAINPRVQANERWSLRLSTPGLLVHAVKHHGWRFIPNQVLPPLVANARLVLYTSYLKMLGVFHEPSGIGLKRVFPPPAFADTLAAGMVAGGIQSLVAAPLDALQTRSDVNEMLEGRHRSIWRYAMHKLQEIGIRGVFAGYGFSLAKESLGYGIFFSSFEYIKQQLYYTYLTHYYGRRRFLEFPLPLHYFDTTSSPLDTASTHTDPTTGKIVIRPHYALEPTFLLLAGVTASVMQQAISFPITQLQAIHYSRLESLDYKTKLEWGRLRERYAHSYGETLEQARHQSSRVGSWRRWLFRGFMGQAARQVPGTSAGLIVFEVVRRRWALEGEKGMRAEWEGYDILLA